jgi:hypothetical protein
MPNEKVDLKPEEQKDGKVLVDKITLENILQRLAAVEDSKQGKRHVRNSTQTAKVRFAGPNEDEVVIGYGKSYEKTELGGRKFLMIEVFTQGKDKKNKYEVEYVHFMEQGKFEEATIISVDKFEDVKEIGYVNKTKVDYNNYTTEDTGVEVPLSVTTLVVTYKLKLANGTEVELPEEALN